jgi:hypothetical protein
MALRMKLLMASFLDPVLTLPSEYGQLEAIGRVSHSESPVEIHHQLAQVLSSAVAGQCFALEHLAGSAMQPLEMRDEEARQSLEQRRVALATRWSFRVSVQLSLLRGHYRSVDSSQLLFLLLA